MAATAGARQAAVRRRVERRGGGYGDGAAPEARPAAGRCGTAGCGRRLRRPARRRRGSSRASAAAPRRRRRRWPADVAPPCAFAVDHQPERVVEREDAVARDAQVEDHADRAVRMPADANLADDVAGYVSDLVDQRRRQPPRPSDRRTRATGPAKRSSRYVDFPIELEGDAHRLGQHDALDVRQRRAARRSRQRGAAGRTLAAAGAASCDGAGADRRTAAGADMRDRRCRRFGLEPRDLLRSRASRAGSSDIPDEPAVEPRARVRDRVARRTADTRRRPGRAACHSALSAVAAGRDSGARSLRTTSITALTLASAADARAARRRAQLDQAGRAPAPSRSSASSYRSAPSRAAADTRGTRQRPASNAR